MKPEELKEIAVLRALDSEALTRLATVLEPKDYADGQSIFAESDPGDGMFFIAAGSVRIEKQTGADASNFKTLAVLEAGDYFGEMSLFDGKPRSASAIASGATRLLRLSQAAFDALPNQGSQAGTSVLFAMLRTSGERIRRLNSHLVVYDEIGKAIGESQNLEDLLDVVARQLCRATLANWGMILLRAQFYDGIELRGASNLQLDDAQRDALARGGSFWAEILRHGREQLVRSTADEEPFKSAAVLGFESSSLLLEPIQIGSQALGMIVLGAEGVGRFGANDLNLARGVARQAAQAILHARHREEEAARVRHGRQFVRF